MSGSEKFTPGPWEVRGNHEHGIEIIGPRQGCRLDGERNKWVLAVIDNGAFPEHEDEDWANAQLMLTAPDLLAACKCLIEDLRERIENGARFNPGTMHAIEYAEAAIAKAQEGT